MRYILFALLLLVGTGICGASQPDATTYPAVAFVISDFPDQQKRGSAGTVTIVEHNKKIKFLTNAHVVATNGYFKYIKFQGGKVRSFSIKKIDHKRDLALLELDAPITTKAVPLAEKSPPKGTAVWGFGFGRNAYQSAKGKITGYDDVMKSLISDIRSISGVSGGLIMDERAHLVGLRWGSNNIGLTNTLMIPVEDVRKFLEE